MPSDIISNIQSNQALVRAKLRWSLRNMCDAICWTWCNEENRRETPGNEIKSEYQQRDNLQSANSLYQTSATCKPHDSDALLFCPINKWDCPPDLANDSWFPLRDTEIVIQSSGSTWLQHQKQDKIKNKKAFVFLPMIFQHAVPTCACHCYFVDVIMKIKSVWDSHCALLIYLLCNMQNNPLLHPSQQMSLMKGCGAVFPWIVWQKVFDDWDLDTVAVSLVSSRWHCRGNKRENKELRNAGQEEQAWMAGLQICRDVLWNWAPRWCHVSF